MVPLFKWHSPFTGMALLLKMFIQGVPSHNPVASEFIRCPTSSLGWVGAGGQRGCPLGSHPPSSWVGAGGQSGCPVGSHPPLSERWPPDHPHQDPHFPLDFPKGSVVDPWGCIKSVEVLHELLEFIIPKVCLQLMWVIPPGWGSLGDNWGFSSLSGVRGWVPKGSPFTTTM